MSRKTRSKEDEDISQYALLPKLETSSLNQKLALQYCREGRKVVILQGSAGCGKSYIAAYHAASLMKQKKINQILLVRANVSVGKSLGMLPGTLEEKLEPFFVQTISHLEAFLGKGETDYAKRHGQIKMQAVEYMRGLSIENSLVIIEEAQGLTASEFEMILSRIGEGSQMIFTGDQKQSDLKGVNGLSATISMIQNAVMYQPNYLEDEDLRELSNGVGIVTFTPDDVVRSGLCKAFVRLYYNNGAS